MEQTLSGYSFYQIALQKKMFNGQNQGMVASYKFVQKIYSLNEKIKNINNQEKLVIQLNYQNL